MEGIDSRAFFVGHLIIDLYEKKTRVRTHIVGFGHGVIAYVVFAE